ncbi:E3 ubiquitin-protein ligase rnf146-like isoform X2 [Pollicipes pollicipes]|nr:E3 ubiquitin-protein ligase rnf146-like isoform X2 [Pollicipes pollicipes]XP_037076502.1 E3 ubiquitin-protein ligase rnf146-like isoform X2 [Pollicipes pollicipes]XP_037076503.1 E3 ubiquitin-protein ligase rnf146-like isoform X2 [Pollicipes pollicipes]
MDIRGSQPGQAPPPCDPSHNEEADARQGSPEQHSLSRHIPSTATAAPPSAVSRHSPEPVPGASGTSPDAPAPASFSPGRPAGAARSSPRRPRRNRSEQPPPADAPPGDGRPSPPGGAASAPADGRLPALAPADLAAQPSLGVESPGDVNTTQLDSRGQNAHDATGQLSSKPQSPSVDKAGSDGPDCAICLQACVHPVQLPCLHVFCFLCAKGAAKNSKRCAMCRADLPLDYLEHPRLLNETQLQREMALSEGYQWFYEGRNGWWKYDERTSAELEAAFNGGQKRAELLVAGYRYVVDLEAMLQLRRSDPARRRRVKRDLASEPKKGVAGIRLGGQPSPPAGDAAVPAVEVALSRLHIGQPPPLPEEEGEQRWTLHLDSDEDLL